MAFKNKMSKNPALPGVQSGLRPSAPIKPVGAPAVPPPRAAAPPGGGLPPGAAQVTGQAKGFGNLALQKPVRPRKQQLVTPGMPLASNYPSAVRTY